jgi:hypothetical protein
MRRPVKDAAEVISAGRRVLHSRGPGDLRSTEPPTNPTLSAIRGFVGPWRGGKVTYSQVIGMINSGGERVLM